MKTVKAWAIVENGGIALISGQLPIYWRGKVAQRESDAANIGDKIVRVEITQVKPKRKARVSQ